MSNSRKESAMWRYKRSPVCINPLKDAQKCSMKMGYRMSAWSWRSSVQISPEMKLVCWGEKKKKCLTFDHPCYESGEVPWFSSISTAPPHRPNWICNMPSVKCNVTRTPCIFHSLPHKLPSRCRDFSENYDPIFLLSSSGTTTTL